MFGSRKKVFFDPGSFKSKLLMISRGIFGRRKLLFDTFRRRPGEALPDLLVRIARETDTEGADWTVSVAANLCHLRELTFPFSDMKKITAVLPHELARVLPFPVQDAEVRMVSSWSTPRGGRGVLVAAIPLSVINHLKADFQKAGIYLDAIVTEFESLAAQFLSSPSGLEGRPAAMVDLGDSQTLVCTFADGNLRYARCLPMGLGNLRQGLKLGVQEFEQLLEEVLSQKTHHPDVNGFLNTLTRELYLSLTASGSASANVEKLYISGGGGDIPHLSDYLGESTGAAIGNWQELLSPSLRSGLASPTAPARRYAGPSIAAGMASIAIDTTLQDRYRSSLLKKETSYGRLVAMSLLFLCLGTGMYAAKLWIEIRRWQSGNRALETRFEQNLESLFPHAVGKDKPLVFLGKNLPQMVSGKRLLTSLPISFLGIVKELSSVLPGPPDFVLEELKTEASLVLLTGKTQSYGNLENLKLKVEESAVFSRVTVKSTTPVRTGETNEVRFELEMELAQ